MRKYPHILKPNTRNLVQEYFIFFDTETYQKPLETGEIEQVLRLGVALYWEKRRDREKEKIEWLYFKKSEEFWQFLENHLKKGKTIWVISHNLPFDFRVINGFSYLKEQNYQPSVFIDNNQVQIWTFKKESKRVCFIDNLNFFRFRLEDLGKIVGLEKKEMPSESETDEKWFDYCQRDVEILYQTWRNWINYIKENDFGCLAKTIASQSFNIFRHRFYKEKIFVHNHQEILNLEREAFRGGRTECFFLGKISGEKFYLLDINSTYPFVMRENEYPVKYLGFFEMTGELTLRHLLRDFCVISKVLIEIEKPIIGKKESGKLIFPTGKFWVVLTTRELEKVLREGKILEIRDTAYYQKANIFRDFVNSLYQMRQEYKEKGNKVYSYLSKLIMNSLYGKFGQLNEVWKKVWYDPSHPDGRFDEVSLRGNKVLGVRYLFGWRYECVGKEEAFNSIPSISAHITADARNLLTDYIEKAGWENVFYCDTDSLIVNSRGFDNLRDYISNNELGKLKIENTSDNLEIYGLKDYRFGEEVKIKGIKKDAKKISENKYLQYHFEGIRMAMRKGNFAKVLVIPIEKVLKRSYNKGRVLKSGYVKPYHLTNAEDNLSPEEIIKILSAPSRHSEKQTCSFGMDN